MLNKPTELWIDALEFANKGGWKEDTQYVHLMGSGYLLAADDVGVPVQDAVTAISIPAAGRYRIWVRDRNWMRSHSPGQFSLIVNSEDTGNVLGKIPSDRWLWEIAGDFDLAEGENTLALHDHTGYFPRCASILITNDLDYVPPREVERLQKERARIKGLSTEVICGGNYDVIVAGGGPGGVPAAIAAARMGAKVLLIHNRPILGGNASSEIGVPSLGAEVAHPRAREGGIAEEIMRLRDRESEEISEWTNPMEALVAAEPNITVVRNSHVCDAEMESESVIRGVIAQDLLTLCKTRYTGKFFIDCTGDAWIGYYAGAKFRYGREAQYQHGESIAPEVADTLSMSGCVSSGNLPYMVDAGVETPFVLPPWCVKLAEDEENFGRSIKGPFVHWWMEAPNDYDDIWDGEEARDTLMTILMSSWDHMKNHWAKKDTLKNYKLNISGIINGRRESRRLIGDYILTQDDCTSGRTFEDTVSYSGWALDIHHPKGIFSGKEGPIYCAVGVPIVKIPYRCLYSKNIENLFCAGRNISTTHIALGTVRVQLTIMTLGQAVGTAAALCLKHNETPRGIYERHIKELQQLLIKNDQYIPGFKNEDEGDPCLTAKVTASSVSTTELFRRTFGVEGDLVPLDRPRATVSAIAKKYGNEFKALYLKLYSSNPEPIPVTIHACAEGNLDTAPNLGSIITAQAMVPPMQEGWVEFPVDLKIDRNTTGEYLRIWIDQTDGLYWRSIENLSLYRQVGEMGEDGTWKIKTGKGYNAAVKIPQDVYADCSPENVINGHSRILSKDIYEWVSDPEQELPQWIELAFEQAVDINTVGIVFDTDMTNPSTCIGYKFPEVSTCVKDYTVEVYDGAAWHKVADITDNFMRKSNHRFDTVKAEKLKVTVLKTCGSPSARITEIRSSLED